MKRRNTTLATAFVLLLVAATSAFANSSFDRMNTKENQFLLRSADIDSVVAEYGITVIRRHGSPSGDIWLVEAPEGSSVDQVLAAMEADVSIQSAEAVSLAGLPSVTLEGRTGNLGSVITRSGTFSTPCLDTYMPGAWSGFSDQALATMIQITDAQNYIGCGEGIVIAVIDTWIDTEHTHLRSAITGGYDFTKETAYFAGAEQLDLDIRQSAIVESSETALLAGQAAHTVTLSNSVVLLGEADPETEADLHALPEYYGHGTMTAGLLRVVAPAAQIMPLVAFDEHGNGHPIDIIAAIYHAVDNGADVINMSFSMNEHSPELYEALEYARSNGVIPVAASGNSGSLQNAFPASYGSTVGVASTDWQDQLTDFSNYGIYTADITAPGVELVTFFPHGTYSLGWGTSFSTPLVAGTVALIRHMHNGSNKGTHKNLRLDLLLGGVYHDYLWDYIYSGRRLNTYGAFVQSL